MRCAWEALLGILPPQLRKNVDVQGREEAQELRLRLGQAPELVMDGKSLLLPGSTSREELDYIVNAASRYSPWAAATAGSRRGEKRRMFFFIANNITNIFKII